MVSIKTVTSGHKRMPKGTTLAVREWIRVVRRLLVLASAIVYIYASLTASYYSFLVLRGFVDRSMKLEQYVSSLIPEYIGSSTIRQSPLVVSVLANSTAPRFEALYLQSKTKISFENCGNLPTFNTWIYNNSYMRTNFQDLVTDTAYNFTFLRDSELILPIVDCTSGAITSRDDLSTRVFYLMRKIHDPNEVYLLTWSLSVQDYVLDDEHQRGATASILLTFLNDVRIQNVTHYHAMRLGFPYVQEDYQAYALTKIDTDGFWTLASIPRPNETEASRSVRTVCRGGFYIQSADYQSNIKNLNLGLLQNPIDAIKRWAWAGVSNVQDSWAWVHGIHGIYGCSAIFNLLVLMLVIYQNARKGKIWIGDAFVAVSSTLTLRALFVLLTWVMNGFWTLMEFCLVESSELTKVQKVFSLS